MLVLAIVLAALAVACFYARGHVAGEGAGLLQILGFLFALGAVVCAILFLVGLADGASDAAAMLPVLGLGAHKLGR